ncbi:MAG: hypothetical protein AB7H97_14420 [Pseudobdellovibrionaceae bacterium]
MRKLVFKISIVYMSIVAIIACSNPSGQFYYGALGLGSQKLVVAVQNTLAYEILIYSIEGTLEDVIADFTNAGDVPKGIAPYDAFSFAVLLDGVDRIARVSLTGSSVPDITTNANLTGTLYQMAFDPTTSYYFAIEGNFIEAFTSSGARIGNPYITTTIGSCVLNTPRGLAMTSDGKLLVTNTGNDRLNVYNVSSAVPTCVSANTSLGANDPLPVIQHSNGLIYYGSQVDDRINSLPSNGTGAPTTVWATNLTVINNPTELLEMPDGTILVASDGTNSIERITTAGVQVGSTSFIRDSFTGFVTQMMLIGGE